MTRRDRGLGWAVSSAFLPSWEEGALGRVGPDGICGAQTVMGWEGREGRWPCWKWEIWEGQTPALWRLWMPRRWGEGALAHEPSHAHR